MGDIFEREITGGVGHGDGGATFRTTGADTGVVDGFIVLVFA